MKTIDWKTWHAKLFLRAFVDDRMWVDFLRGQWDYSQIPNDAEPEVFERAELEQSRQRGIEVLRRFSAAQTSLCPYFNRLLAAIFIY